MATVEAGTQVIYSKYAGTELEINGSTHILLKEDDIVGVLDTDDIKDLKPLNDRVLIKVAAPIPIEKENVTPGVVEAEAVAPVEEPQVVESEVAHTVEASEADEEAVVVESDAAPAFDASEAEEAAIEAKEAFGVESEVEPTVEASEEEEAVVAESEAAPAVEASEAGEDVTTEIEATSEPDDISKLEEKTEATDEVVGEEGEKVVVE